MDPTGWPIGEGIEDIELGEKNNLPSDHGPSPVYTSTT